MKAFPLTCVKRLTSQYWLLGVAACSIAVQVTLADRSGNPNLFASSLLFWFATGFLVWKKRHHLNLKTSTIPCCLGLLIVAAILLKSFSKPTEPVLGVAPFFSALGLSLLASGFGGFRQFWREIVILFFLGVPRATLQPIINIAEITAQFSTFMLWYSGFSVQRQGINISLPQGAIEVNTECSGLGAMLYMLGTIVLVLLVFPLQGTRKKVGLLAIALATAFVINGFRVALMVILLNHGYTKAFHFMHGGEGSFVFSMVPVGMVGSLYFFLLRREAYS